MDTAIDLQVYTVRQIEELGLSYAIGGTRGLREPWQAVCLRWREAVAAKDIAR